MLLSLEILILILEQLLLQAKRKRFYTMKIVKVTAGQMPGRKVKLTFGLMLVSKHAPAQLQLPGNILTPPHQQRPNVNGQVVLDWIQLR